MLAVEHVDELVASPERDCFRSRIVASSSVAQLGIACTMSRSAVRFPLSCAHASDRRTPQLSETTFDTSSNASG